MCGVFGVALIFVQLCPLSWMLADIVLTSRFLVQPPPKKRFLVYLCIIGWGKLYSVHGHMWTWTMTLPPTSLVLPFFLCAIPVAMLGVFNPPFLSSFSYPNQYVIPLHHYDIIILHILYPP